MLKIDGMPSSLANLYSAKRSSGVPLGSSKVTGLGDARRDAAASLAFEAHPRELLDDVAEVAAGRDLERQPLELAGLAAHQLDRLEALLAAEEDAVLACAR